MRVMKKSYVKDILEYYFDHACWDAVLGLNAMKSTNKLAGADVNLICNYVWYVLIEYSNKQKEWRTQEQPGLHGRCTVIVYGNNVVKNKQSTVAEDSLMSGGVLDCQD